MEKNSKIVVFGGRGLLGSAIKKLLKGQGYENVSTPTSKEVNLLERRQIEDFLKINKPEYIFMTAGLVGGILKNKTYPADFLYQNSLMILNLLEGIKNTGTKSKFLYTGSTCIYPGENPQPINEERFMAGKLEETNKGYAIAKVMGIVACQLYRQQYGLEAICAMPTNLYGPNDNYDLSGGHMIPSLIKKILMAKKDKKESITLWGTGNPRREALYSEDCADALIYLMNNYSSNQIINIGTGFDYSIDDFAQMIGKNIGWNGKIVWDKSKPDGVFEKRTDISRLKKIYPLFKPRTFNEGLNNILSYPKEIKRILS